jgi:hypothetical protein
VAEQLYSVNLPASAIRRMAFWAREFSVNWKLDTPSRLHQREIAPDGSPQWHPEFANWLSETNHKRVPDDQRRTRKAFRQLRKVAPREFEVAYRFCIQGENLGQIAEWLSDRSERIGKTDRYDNSAALLILYSAIDKLMSFF